MGQITEDNAQCTKSRGDSWAAAAWAGLRGDPWAGLLG